MRGSAGRSSAPVEDFAVALPLRASTVAQLAQDAEAVVQLARDEYAARYLRHIGADVTERNARLLLGERAIAPENVRACFRADGYLDDEIRVQTRAFGVIDAFDGAPERKSSSDALAGAPGAARRAPAPLRVGALAGASAEVERRLRERAELLQRAHARTQSTEPAVERTHPLAVLNTRDGRVVPEARVKHPSVSDYETGAALSELQRLAASSRRLGGPRRRAVSWDGRTAATRPAAAISFASSQGPAPVAPAAPGERRLDGIVRSAFERARDMGALGVLPSASRPLSQGGPRAASRILGDDDTSLRPVADAAHFDNPDKPLEEQALPMNVRRAADPLGGAPASAAAATASQSASTAAPTKASTGAQPSAGGRPPAGARRSASTTTARSGTGAETLTALSRGRSEFGDERAFVRYHYTAINALQNYRAAEAKARQNAAGVSAAPASGSSNTGTGSSSASPAVAAPVSATSTEEIVVVPQLRVDRALCARLTAAVLDAFPYAKLAEPVDEAQRSLLRVTAAGEHMIATAQALAHLAYWTVLGGSMPRLHAANRHTLTAKIAEHFHRAVPKRRTTFQAGMLLPFVSLVLRAVVQCALRVALPSSFLRDGMSTLLDATVDETAVAILDPSRLFFFVRIVLDTQLPTSHADEVDLCTSVPVKTLVGNATDAKARRLVQAVGMHSGDFVDDLPRAMRERISALAASHLHAAMASRVQTPGEASARGRSQSSSLAGTAGMDPPPFGLRGGGSRPATRASTRTGDSRHTAKSARRSAYDAALDSILGDDGDASDSSSNSGSSGRSGRAGDLGDGGDVDNARSATTADWMNGVDRLSRRELKALQPVLRQILGMPDFSVAKKASTESDAVSGVRAAVAGGVGSAGTDPIGELVSGFLQLDRLQARSAARKPK